MKILIHTPDGDLKFHAPVMKIKDYTLDSLFEKKLYFLLPFFAFNHEDDFKQYDSDPAQLEELKQEYVRIINGLEQAKASGELYQVDVRSIITMSRKVIENLVAQFKNVKKGVDSVMGGQILGYEGKTIFNKGKQEGRQEGINENRQRMATDMLRDGEPLEKIIRYSKLAKDAVLSLANSIGISVVK